MSINPSVPAASGWTLDTLKTVVEAEISALDKVTTSRFVAGDTRASEAQEAIKVGLANAQRALDAAAVLAKDAVGEAKIAHAAEHAAQAMALTLSTLELKERLVEMNNFRKQIAEERGDFVTRDRLADAVSAMEGIITTAISTVTATAGLLEARVTTVSAAIALVDQRLSGLQSDVTTARTTTGEVGLKVTTGAAAIALVDQRLGAMQLDLVSGKALSAQTSQDVAALAKVVNDMRSTFVAYGTALGVAVVAFEIFMRYVVK